MILLIEPRFGRRKWEGTMIYLGRRVVDCIIVFQNELLTITCPLTDEACLDKI